MSNVNKASSYTLTAKEASERADLWEQVRRGEVKVTAQVIGRRQVGAVELTAALGFNARDSRWYFWLTTHEQFSCGENYALTVTAQNVSAASSAPIDPTLPAEPLHMLKREDGSISIYWPREGVHYVVADTADVKIAQQHRDKALTEAAAQKREADSLRFLYNDLNVVMQEEMQTLGDLLGWQGAAMGNYGIRHLTQHVTDLIAAAQAVLDDLQAIGVEPFHAQALRALLPKDTQ